MNHIQKLVLAVLVLFSSHAFADQCSWNNKSVAQRVRNFLAYYPGEVYTYCEPCGDTEMKSVYIGYDYESTLDGRAIHSRQQMNQTASGDVIWQLKINEAYAQAGINREIDLAYTFIKTNTGYLNLGARFSCLNNKFWNPDSKEDFSGTPQYVSPWIRFNEVPVVEDVNELDYMKAHELVYPDKPQG